MDNARLENKKDFEVTTFVSGNLVLLSHRSERGPWCDKSRPSVLGNGNATGGLAEVTGLSTSSGGGAL